MRSGRHSTRSGLAWIALLVAALVFVAGCGESDDDDGWYTLVLVPAPGTDPFADPDAEFLYLRVETATLELVAEETFPIDADDLSMDDAPTGRGLYFVVEVREADDTVIAEGRSGPHALEKGEHTTITVVLEAP
jgi:hypothetical protein